MEAYLRAAGTGTHGHRTAIGSTTVYPSGTLHAENHADGTLSFLHRLMGIGQLVARDMGGTLAVALLGHRGLAKGKRLV